MRESFRQSLKRGGLHLALIAMMLHALLPTGWMPSAEAGAPLIVCTAAGAAEHDSADKQKQADAKEHSICPFAAASVSAPPQNFIALPAPSENDAAELSFASGDSFIAEPRFAQSSPRAPPTLV